MNNLKYNYDKKYTLLYDNRNIFNNDKIIVSNPKSGQWLKLSMECYTIIKDMCTSSMSINELLEALYDDEDRLYMIEVINKLIELNILIDNDDFKNEFDLKINNISFSITHRCNLRCTHCCIDSNIQQGYDTLTTEDIFKCIDRILLLKPKKIILTGGEPLLRDDFYDILIYANKKFDGNVSVMSNGTLINEINAEILAKLTDSVEFSIDGVDEESCSIIRGKGVFDKVISAISLLQKHGQKKISLSIVETPNNSRVIGDFDELCKRLNVKKIIRAFENNMGRARSNRYLLENTYTHKKPDNDYIDTMPTPESIKIGTCGAYYFQLSIEENGDLYPCELLNDDVFKICNILEVEDLYSYISNTQNYQSTFDSFQSIMPNIFERCKNCKVNFFCVSCMHEIYKMKNDIQEFYKYCEGRRCYLHKMVWDEEINEY